MIGEHQLRTAARVGRPTPEVGDDSLVLSWVDAADDDHADLVSFDGSSQQSLDLIGTRWQGLVSDHKGKRNLYFKGKSLGLSFSGKRQQAQPEYNSNHSFFHTFSSGIVGCARRTVENARTRAPSAFCPDLLRPACPSV